MSKPIIEVHNVSKLYRLGVIGATTLRDSFERWWHKVRDHRPRDHETTWRILRGQWSCSQWSVVSPKWSYSQWSVVGNLAEGPNGLISQFPNFPSSIFRLTISRFCGIINPHAAEPCSASAGLSLGSPHSLSPRPVVGWSGGRMVVWLCGRWLVVGTIGPSSVERVACTLEGRCIIPGEELRSWKGKHIGCS
jgi:hypothetical protein